jgi:ABC-type multidrug transport system ATPase subunit
MAKADRPGSASYSVRTPSSTRFPNGRVGLHELHLAENSGKLIGIMGGSGSGKSTLLNVLNGNLRPSSGRSPSTASMCMRSPTASGGDRPREPGRPVDRGAHGFPEPLLQCHGCASADQDKSQVAKRVLGLLQSLGLYETKDLKVGSPLEKTISGGQRKRLNIALELIREPSVLFVDEPTSGLSSRDSENIMDLLKELALKGRIVFVVIHQPSSEIFKLFDRLLLMDQEGNPVYYGDPVDAVVYFKKVTGQADSESGPVRGLREREPRADLQHPRGEDRG